MENNLVVTKWDFFTDDWVSSIDVLYNKYIFLGCRNGTLHILDLFGTPISSIQLSSWIGALRVFPFYSHLKLNDASTFLFVGTKDGDFYCYQITSIIPFHYKELFKHKAKNTIRKIDISCFNNEIEDIYIAVGSEDKHVYIFNLLDIVSKRSGIKITKTTANGWIRSIAFCASPSGEKYIAAGCGDKKLHIYNIYGDEIDFVYVNSKIHALATDQRSSDIYCVSDARKLYIISPKEDKRFYIRKEIQLPQRGNSICYIANDNSKIVISSERGYLYLFDLRNEKIISEHYLNEPIYSLYDISEKPLNSFTTLLGLGSSRLSCVTYYSSTGNNNKNCSFIADPYQISSTKGKITSNLKIGIGRFIYAILDKEETYIFVGTDEGSIYLILVHNGKLSSLGFETLDNKRVWSIYAYIVEPAAEYRLYVGTSDNYVSLYKVTINRETNKCNFSLDQKIIVGDWAREIRPIIGGKEDEVIIACESGDIVIYPEKEKSLKKEEVYRSVFCSKTPSYLEIVTGSDNNLISYYHNDTLKWQYLADDRIRETLIHEDTVISVSEDRYMYIINKRGNISSRYFFPHRALCIDIIRTQDTFYMVIGCGDGFVYFLSKIGEVIHAYKFPDRVRDVVSVSNMIYVACEDLYIYSTEIPSKLSNSQSPSEQCTEIISKLFEEDNSLSLIMASSLEIEEKVYLIEYSNYWWKSDRTDLLIYLIDFIKNEISFCDNLKNYYIYANTLIFLTIRVDIAVGISRIQRYLQEPAAIYNSHSMITALIRYKISFPIVKDKNIFLIIEKVVSLINLNKDWILEESVKMLHAFHFFHFGDHGIERFFNKIHLTVKKYDIIFAFAKQNYIDEPVVKFLEKLVDLVSIQETTEKNESIRNIIENDHSKAYSGILNFFLTDNCYENNLTDIDLDSCIQWFLREVSNADLKSIISSLLLEDNQLNRYQGYIKLIKEIFDLKIRQDHVLLSGKDYILQKIFTIFLELLSKVTKAT